MLQTCVSETKQFIEKCFTQKLRDFEVYIKWCRYEGHLHMIFKRLSKVKLTTPSCVSLEVTKPLCKTFFYKLLRFRDISLQHFNSDSPVNILYQIRNMYVQCPTQRCFYYIFELWNVIWYVTKLRHVAETSLCRILNMYVTYLIQNVYWLTLYIRCGIE